ncbi:hypothetical protein BS78_02G116600 [Paspalum vaginatum]|nr:hypothetical protein BS78_02G116600 [Paspalum vaginatum]
MAGARLAARPTHSPAQQLPRARDAVAAAADRRRHRDPHSLPRGFCSKLACSIGNNGYSKVTRVLFCGLYFPASTKYTKEYLQKYPFIEVDEVGLEKVPDVIHDYHICVVKSRRINSDVIAKATHMKIIMQYGVGLEGVDVTAATEHKNQSCKDTWDYDRKCSLLCRDGNLSYPWSSAEAKIDGYCCESEGPGPSNRRNDIWENSMPGVEAARLIHYPWKLSNLCNESYFLITVQVLILGFGAIGVEIAKRLKPFGVKNLATKRNWSPGSLPCDIDGLVDKKGGPEDIYELAGEADIVITCLLQTNETVRIIDHMFLSAMEQGSCLVNIARGVLLNCMAVFN